MALTEEEKAEKQARKEVADAERDFADELEDAMDVCPDCSDLRDNGERYMCAEHYALFQGGPYNLRDDDDSEADDEIAGGVA
jgi:hypothetical protein